MTGRATPIDVCSNASADIMDQFDLRHLAALDRVLHHAQRKRDCGINVILVFYSVEAKR